MSRIKNLSNWAKEMELGEVYENLTENDNVFENAYEAINKFCNKDQKRRNIPQKNKMPGIKFQIKYP